MGKISLLSVGLANKIAAGEVVERPASVVKELVENAIDAQSRRIFVNVLEGGVRLIQVVDDGEGIAAEDVPLAFERHATSKISTDEDLTEIMTLGFRGEALPSIASVSRMSLVSRRAESDEGAEIHIEGGVVQSVQAVGSPKGSTFEVRDLFYNVPARRKFLKSQQTEMGHIHRVLMQLALAHFGIHFQLTHGGRTLFDVPAAASFQDRAFQLLGEKVTVQSITLSGDLPAQPGLLLQALISRPPLKKNLKKEQYLFVNLRPVKSPLMTHAVYEAYKSYLMKGEDPFFILFLDVDPKTVDVNVHPGKLEVRFENTSQMHQAIRNIVREALATSGAGPLEKSETPAFDRAAFARDLKNSGGHPAPERWAGWPEAARSRDRTKDMSELVHEGSAIFSPTALFTRPSDDLLDPSSEGHGPSDVPMIRPLAQVYGTFLLAEINGELTIVDQHTAHERVLYETFLSAWEKNDDDEKNLEIQPLLIPQQIDLSQAKSLLLREHLEGLGKVGIKIESFGETTFLVRELPALIAKMDVVNFLNEVTDDLIDLGVTGAIDEPIRTIMASMACHGAVRAHQSMSLPEIKALLEMYYARKTPPTCPHGRPILLRYPLLELEKLFRRK